AAEVIAWCGARLVGLIADGGGCQTQAVHLGAHFVTIDKKADSFRPAPKFARPNRSCLADSMICAHVERSVCGSYNKLVTMTHNFTIQRKHRCVGYMRFF